MFFLVLRRVNFFFHWLNLPFLLVNEDADSEMNNAPGTSCGIGTRLLDNVKRPVLLLYWKQKELVEMKESFSLT